MPERDVYQEINSINLTGLIVKDKVKRVVLVNNEHGSSDDGQRFIILLKG